MYTLVLMTAITTGNTTPDFFFRGGCHGCFGYAHSCHGCWGGCHGSTRNGCYGSSSYGCYGSSSYGCYGSSSYGCYGSSSNGCYGGCQGQVFTGGNSGIYTPVFTGQQPPEVIYPPKDKEKEPGREVQQVRATMTVDVPADGKLYIDGTLMKSGSGPRTFQTPALNPGQLYFYDVRVEIVRNGKTITDTQRVVLRPGQLASSSFAHLERQATEPATAAAGQQ